MTDVEEQPLIIKTPHKDDAGYFEKNNGKLESSDGQGMLCNKDKDGIKSSLWKDTNWLQKALIMYISIVNYLTFLCNGTASPFLARVLLEKGGTVLFSSFVLQVSMLTMTISSFILAKYQSRIGCKTLIIVGQSVFGLCQMGFGTIGYFQDLWALVVVGATLRAIQGMCQAAIAVCGLTIVFQEFPEFISFMFGVVEAAYGTGYLTGPYVGGFLFDISGGMMIPMTVTGVLTLSFSLMGIGVIQKSYRCEDQSSHSQIMYIMKQPKALLVVGVAGTMIGGFAVCDATITVYLQSKQFSATDVGQLLFLMGVSYSVFALFLGWFINTRTTLRRIIMSIGLLGALIFPLLLTNNQTDTVIYIATFGFATCSTFVYIPSFNELLHILSKDVVGSSARDMPLDGAVSGVWTASSAVCNFMIPMAASIMELYLSFSVSFWCSMLVGYGFSLVGVVIVSLLGLVRSKYSK